MKAFLISTLGLAAISMANAGPIQVGQIVGGQNLGLTSAYVTGGCMGTGPCINTSSQSTLNTTGFIEANYAATLFGGATLSSPQPFSGYSSTVATPTGSTLTDPASNITYAMISDGLTSSSTSKNYWNASSASSITIPVGVFSIQQVWTLLDERWGTNGQQDTSVTFNFSTTSDGSSGLTPVTMDLSNGTQVRGSVNCTSGNTTNCSGYAQNLSSPTSQNGVTMTSENVWNTAYSFGPSGHGKYNSTSGTLQLDDIGFNFASTAYSSMYLVDIVVVDKSGALNTNQTGLSAVTLLATPEPSTFFLLGAAVIGLGIARKRLS